MKRWTVFAMASYLCLTLAACAGASGFSDEAIRYKMIVTVQAPEGVKSGFAVREAARHTEPRILPEQGGASYNITKAEAVAVDLGNRGVFFVLLGGEHEAQLVFKSFRSEKKQSQYAIELSQAQYPRFVRFRNLNDPKTIESVSHHNTKDMPNGYGGNSLSFQKLFGSDVSFLAVSIQETDEQPTNTISKYLPWLEKKSMLPGAIGGAPETPFKDPTNTWVTAAEIKK